MDKGKNKSELTQAIIKLMFAIFSLILAIILVFMVGKYVIQNFENNSIKKEFELQETIAPTLENITLHVDEENDTAEVQEQEIEEPISEEAALEIYLAQGQKQYNHEGLKAVNSDYCGWLDIPGTSISYPVVQSEDNVEYLTRSFEGKKRSSGSIFVDANIRDIKKTRNLVIHGHNMKSGSMFAMLPSYKNISYYNKHPFIYLYTPDETMVYQVISAYTLKHDANEEVAYQGVFADNEDFKNFVSGLLNRSVIDTNVDGIDEEQILTLSTCVNHSTSRFIVHAVRFPLE
jgi:sortase B